MVDYVAGEDIRSGQICKLGEDGRLYAVDSKKIKRIAEKDFMESLKNNPAYAHINIDQEFRLMDVWLGRHKDRQKTRLFVLRWLERKEVPLNFEKDNKIRRLMQK